MQRKTDMELVRSAAVARLTIHLHLHAVTIPLWRLAHVKNVIFEVLVARKCQNRKAS